MQRDFRPVALIVVICTVIVGVPTVTPRAVSAQTVGPNLLVAGGFEAPPPRLAGRRWRRIRRAGLASLLS